MVSLPSVSNVMAYGGMPQKYTQLPVSFVSAHNRGRRRTGNQNLRSSHHRAVAVSSQPLVRGGRRARGSVIVNRLVMVGPFSRRHPEPAAAPSRPGTTEADPAVCAFLGPRPRIFTVEVSVTRSELSAGSSLIG